MLLEGAACDCTEEHVRGLLQARFGVLALVGEAVNRVPHQLKHRMRQLMLKPHGCIIGRPQAGRIWPSINKSMCRLGLDRQVMQCAKSKASS